MAASAILAVRILADAKGAQKGMAEAQAATQRWAAGVNRAATVAGVAIAAGALKATKGASDLAETMSKTQTVFGASSAAMVQWSEGAAKAFGLSQQEALDAASSFQVMFTQLGIGAGTSQDMSKGMIQAAADLASFHNVAGGAAEVTDMLSSAMRGEYDSLQRLIPNINAAAVQQQALAMTHKKSKSDLTDAEKAAATYALVLKGMGPAAGDWAKTADGAANSQRTLTATMKDTSDQMGSALLPALQSLLGVAKKVAGWAKDNPKQFKAIALAIVGVVAAVKLVNAALMTYRAIMTLVAVAQAAVFLTNPIFLVVAAVIALVAVFVLLWKRSKKFRDFVKGMWAAIKAAAVAVARAIKTAWEATFKAIKTAAKATGDFIKAVWNVIKGHIAAVASFFKAVWNASIAVVRGYFNAYKAVVLAVFNAIKTAISTVASFLRTAFNTSVNVVKSLFNTLKAVVTAPFDAINAAIRTVIGWIDKLIDKIKQIDFTPGFSVPDWLNPFNAAAPPAPALSRAARGAPTTRTSAGGGGTVIHIHGAIDPEGTARQIQRILGGHGHRVGTLPTI